MDQKEFDEVVWIVLQARIASDMPVDRRELDTVIKTVVSQLFVTIINSGIDCGKIEIDATISKMWLVYSQDWDVREKRRACNSGISKDTIVADLFENDHNYEVRIRDKNSGKIFCRRAIPKPKVKKDIKKIWVTIFSDCTSNSYYLSYSTNYTQLQKQLAAQLQNPAIDGTTLEVDLLEQEIKWL